MNQDMRVVQKKILEIAVYLDEFCKNHNIEYYLMGGSALGAIRHRGFIPWDDDFDVFMTYENYKKFIEACERHIDKERFYLQKEDTDEWPMFFTKLRMNNTTYLEDDTKGRKMHHGFFVDIMCLNNTSKYVVIRYIQYLSARILTAYTLSKRGYITDKSVKKMAIGIAELIVTKRVKRILLRIVRGLNSSKPDYVGHFFGRAEFKKMIFPTYYLGNPRYVEFDGVEFPVPKFVEKYLETRFGKNFMQIPNQNVRDEYPVHASFVDVERGIDSLEFHSKG